MDKARKIEVGMLLLAVLAIAGVAGLVMFGTPSASNIPQGNGKNGDSVTYTGVVCVTAVQGGGYEDYGCFHNFITNRGKDLIKMALTANSTPIVTNILALGNVTGGQQLVTDTNLASEYTVCGLAAAAGTQASQAPNGNWSVAKTFTYTGAGCISNVVNITGIYNTTASGNLLAEANFTSVTLNTGDQITITYHTWVS